MQPNNHSIFNFTDDGFVSAPSPLSNNRIASCLYFGNDKNHAVVLCSDQDGSNLTEYLFSREQFEELGNNSQRLDPEALIETHGRLISNSTSSRRRADDEHETELSIRTRRERVKDFNEIGLKLFDIDGEFEETAAEIQTKHEAELSIKLRPDGGAIDKKALDQMLIDGADPGQFDKIPPIQTSSIEIPDVLKATTSITYARLQLPDGKNGLAKIVGPVHFVRFDFIELTGDLYRETITYETKIEHYVETFRKEVLKESSFGFGLALGIGAVPTPPDNKNQTQTGDDRYEKGKKVKDQEPDKGTGKDPDKGNGSDPDKGTGSDPDKEPDKGTGSDPDKGSGTEPDKGDENRRFKPGFGIAISAGLAFKKHRITEHSIDEFVASIKPVERVVDKLT